MKIYWGELTGPIPIYLKGGSQPGPAGVEEATETLAYGVPEFDLEANCVVYKPKDVYRRTDEKTDAGEIIYKFVGSLEDVQAAARMAELYAAAYPYLPSTNRSAG